MIIQAIVRTRTMLVFRIVMTRTFAIIALDTSCHSFDDFLVRIELPTLFNEILHSYFTPVCP